MTVRKRLAGVHFRSLRHDKHHLPPHLGYAASFSVRFINFTVDTETAMSTMLSCFGTNGKIVPQIGDRFYSDVTQLRFNLQMQIK